MNFATTVTDNGSLITSPKGEDERPAIDLQRHLALFRRRLKLLLAIALCVFLATIIVTIILPKKYTATSEVMLDPRQQNVSNIQGVLSGIPSTDAGAVDTEVEVLKSRSLAEKVVAAKHLDQDEEFNSALKPKAPWSGLLPKGPPLPEAVRAEEAHNKIVDRVMKATKIARSGLTSVIRIHFESKSAVKAAEISNQFADSYLVEQLDAKFDATRRAAQWLNARLATLKQQVEDAEAAAARYKAEHGLMGLSSSEGATIAQQEISTINTQLATSRAEEAEAEAKLSTARTQLANGSNGEDLGAALDSPVINQLRAQRAVVSGQVADMEGRLGPRHPDMLKAQRQLADIDGQIQGEIKRITSNLEAQAAVARQRTISIRGSLSNSQVSLANNGTAAVELNNLQRNADALSSLYQTYLDRFKQTSNQQGMDQSDSRIVSQAKIPTEPSYPNIPLNVALAVILGVAAAVGAMFVVEAMENGLYTSEDVEKLMGVAHLGSIPAINSILGRTDARKINGTLSPIRYVVDKPLSSFAEAFRQLRTSIAFSKIGGRVQLIAITSALPGEGKTTTSVCLGRVTALGGSSTVVVDCDLRRRTINRMFDGEPEWGLLDILSNACTLEDALVYDEASGAYFILLAQNKFTPKDVFSSIAMDNLIAQLRERFDVIILDTAPILPVVDTKTLAAKCDVTVVLSRWRRTPRKATETALKQLDAVGAQIVGIALTQVDMKEQARSGYGDAGYYYRAYKSYYGEAAY